MSLQRIEKAEKRIKTVEDAIVLLTILTQNNTRSDRLKSFLFSLEELRAGQKKTEEKLNALINARIVTEDKLQPFEAENNQFWKQPEKEMQEIQVTMRDLMQSLKIVNQKIEENRNE